METIDYPILGRMTQTGDGTWFARIRVGPLQAGEVELCVDGDAGGPAAGPCESAVQVAANLPSVLEMVREYAAARTAVPENEWPADIPKEFHRYVGGLDSKDAGRYWEVMWLEFRTDRPGTYTAFLTFYDRAQEMAYVLWIVEVQDSRPCSLGWRHW